jgi:hypothetical protein
VTEDGRQTWLPDSEDQGPPRFAGEVRVICGVQVMARPSAVGDYLVWVNLPQQGLPAPALPPALATKLTRDQWIETHMEMLRRGGDETRFREFIPTGDWPDLPGKV